MFFNGRQIPRSPFKFTPSKSTLAAEKTGLIHNESESFMPENRFQGQKTGLIHDESESRFEETKKTGLIHDKSESIMPNRFEGPPLLLIPLLSTSTSTISLSSSSCCSNHSDLFSSICSLCSTFSFEDGSEKSLHNRGKN